MAGMTPTPARGGGKKSVDAAINLVPFIDLLSCCISFLLITAVWTQLAAIDLPRHETGAETERDPVPKERPRARLVIDARGYVFVAAGGKSATIEGSADKDARRLGELLAAARRDAADDTRLTVEVADGTAYGRVLEAVDLARAARWADVGFTGAGG